MDRGCSNSPFDLRSHVLSFLQFLLVQKCCYSKGFKAIIDMAGETFLHIRSAVINENLIDIAVGIVE